MYKYVIKPIIGAFFKVFTEYLIRTIVILTIATGAVWYLSQEPEKPKAGWFTKAEKPKGLVQKYIKPTAKKAAKKVGIYEEKPKLTFWQSNKNHAYMAGCTALLAMTTLVAIGGIQMAKDAKKLTVFKANIAHLIVCFLCYEFIKKAYNWCYQSAADLSVKTWGEWIFGDNKEYGWLKRKWLMYGDNILFWIDTAIRTVFGIILCAIFYGRFKGSISAVLNSKRGGVKTVDKEMAEMPTKK